MRRIATIVLGISLFVLSACSNQEEHVSIVDSMESEAIQLTEMKTANDTELNDIVPISYQLENGEVIKVYQFVSEDQRELGQQQFQENQQLLSSHSPIMYDAKNFLVLYYSNVNSATQTPELSETTYGKQIEKAIKQIQ